MSEYEECQHKEIYVCGSAPNYTDFECQQCGRTLALSYFEYVQTEYGKVI